LRKGGRGDVRSQQRHVRAADDGVRDLSVERADSNKHDRVHERGEHVLRDDDEEESARRAAAGEDGDDELREARSDEAADEGPAPDVHGRVRLAPFSDVVAQEDFDGEVDEDDEGELFLLEALVEELQAGDCVVGLEADLRDQVDDDEGLDVLELQDAPHGLVDFFDAVRVAVAVFALQECETESHDEVRPAPECEVAVELEETGVGGGGGWAEPFVREVLRVEGKEYGV
jgi:hypothetical protein